MFGGAVSVVYGFFVPEHHYYPAMDDDTIHDVATAVDELFPVGEAERWVVRAREDKEQAWLLLELLLASGEQGVVKYSTYYQGGKLFYVDGGVNHQGNPGFVVHPPEGAPHLSRVMLMGAMALQDKHKSVMDTLASAVGVEADWLLLRGEDADDQ